MSLALRIALVVVAVATFAGAAVAERQGLVYVVCALISAGIVAALLSLVPDEP